MLLLCPDHKMFNNKSRAEKFVLPIINNIHVYLYSTIVE